MLAAEPQRSAAYSLALLPLLYSPVPHANTHDIALSYLDLPTSLSNPENTTGRFDEGAPRLGTPLPRYVWVCIKSTKRTCTLTRPSRHMVSSCPLPPHSHARYPSHFQPRALPLKAVCFYLVLRVVLSPVGIQVPCGFWAVHSASQRESRSFTSPWPLGTERVVFVPSTNGRSL